MKSFLQKWGICILLFLATTLNYLDRQTMAILAPTIQDEMNLDNTALGWLFAVFYYTYAFSQFGVGALLDRSNLRWTYGWAVVAWSASCALTGLAGGFAGLVLFRLLLGVTESANWPAALRVVSRLLPPRERPMGNGIFTSGTGRSHSYSYNLGPRRLAVDLCGHRFSGCSVVCSVGILHPLEATSRNLAA